MKKSVPLLISFVLICALFAGMVSADAKVTVEAVNDKITDLENGYAEFNIMVENTGPDQETYTLWNLDPPSWFAQVMPSVAYKTRMIAAGDTSTFNILIRSSELEKSKGKAIIVTAFIREASNPSQPFKAPMRVVIGPTPGDAAPDADFDVSVSAPSQMDPNENYNIVVDLKNNNARILDDVRITLSSELINEDTVVTVNPDESKSASFAVLFFDNIQPQQDQLHVLVEYDGEVFYEADHNLEVVAYLPPFTTDIQVEKKFLRQDRLISVWNEGNTEKTDTIRLQASLKDRIFSSASPDFEFVKEDGKYFLTWPLTLGPDGSTEITLVTSYRWLLFAVILILLYLTYVTALSNPLIVKKKFQAVHKEHKGAISDMSVVIYLKNRGNDSITGLRVVERVSKMVKLKHDSFEGSMHPSKMHSHEEGTLLEYRFAELGPGDERIIKYKVYSRLHMFGTIVIKPTVVEFKTKKGARKSSKSRELTITAGEALSAKPAGIASKVEKKEPKPEEDDIELTSEDFQEVEDIQADDEDQKE